jgi:glutathione synthase/RimK-type ligase-like ATP-grasp enzyme
VSAKKCLIITDKGDEKWGHVPFIAQHLSPSQFVVVDPIPSIIDGQGLSYKFDKQGVTCTFNGKPLTNIVSIWDRRPSQLDTKEMLSQVDPDFVKYAATAIRNHAMHLYALFPQALWVSDYFATLRAERKPLQLLLAKQLGFRIPETLFTSDPAEAQAFIRNRPETIVKGQSSHGPYKDKMLFMFYSVKVTPDSTVDFSNLSLAPAIFQQAIDVDYDLRITVVGNKVFPARVVAHAEKDQQIGVRDWRIGNHAGELSIEACKLPVGVQEKCLALVKKLGLKFGAIDMILDKKGTYWFIEINPNGQWAFVERSTGQPIGKAIAELLLPSS